MRTAIIAWGLVLATVAPVRAQSTLEPAARAPEHVLPIRYVDRPLTLPEGSFRLDHALVLDIERTQLLLNAPSSLAVGLTDWLEIGATYTFLRDPGLHATARWAHSDVIDAGLRAQVTIPAFTHGTTNLTVSLPIVLRLGGWVRVQTAVIGEFLLAQRMEPTLRFPLEVAVQMSRRSFFVAHGNASLVDRRYWHGAVGFFFGHTVAATAIRPLVEVRVGSAFLFGNATGGGSFAGFEMTVALAFFMTAHPTGQ